MTTAPTGEAAQPVAESLSAGAEEFRRTAATFLDTSLTWMQDNATQASIAAAGAVVLFIALVSVRRAAVFAIKRVEWKDQTSYAAIVARAVQRISTVFLLFAAVATATLFVQPPEAVVGPLRLAFIVAAVIQTAMIAREVLSSLVGRRATRTSGDAATLKSALSVVRWFIGVAVWSVALLVILENIGVDVTALIAGLGIAGVAIGLAAQGIFSDLFSALSILFDKPFRKGDFIIFNDTLGEVEEIGLKTTRLRSLSGEQVVVSNTNLLDETIHNYERMQERRIVIAVGVTYQTSHEKLAAIQRWIKEEIEALDKLRFDRAHFATYGPSSLDFEIVFYVLSADYNDYMDARHRVNLALFRRFADEGVDFAYPTQTLMLAAPDGRGVDPREMAAAPLDRDAA